jgi:tRNA-splicing ligase RtcB
MKGADIVLELGRRGITVKAENIPSLAEEASQAYKDVTEIIDVVHKAGISRKVALAVPMGIIKG